MMKLKLALRDVILICLLLLLTLLSFMFGKSFNQSENFPIKQDVQKEEVPDKEVYAPLPLDVTFNIPNGFSVRSIQSGSSADPRNTYVYVRSSDFVLSHTEIGYPFISSGAEFSVSVSKTTDSNVEEYLNRSPLFQQIATQRIDKNINGVRVIQYDMSWEGSNNTAAVFIKEGYVYSVAYGYKDLTVKPQYIKEFGEFLNSVVKESKQSKY